MDRLILPEVDSTMNEAARSAARLLRPTWILALRQTAGRGRRGRDWRDPPGNFAATLVLRPEGGPAEAARHSFVAALALHDALAEVTGLPDLLSIKWPNDVLLNGGKVAGILLESGSAGGMTHLAIGIGVNLAHAPDRAEVEPHAMPPASVAGATGLRITPEEFLPPLARAFGHWLDQQGRWGFAAIRTAWLSRAARLGQVITARVGPRTLEGRFETIDETGALVLTTPAGREAIPAADVYF